jgi:hypothetical protein
VAVIGAGLILFFAFRRADRRGAWLTPPRIAGFGIGTLLLASVCGALVLESPRFLSSVDHPRSLYPPLITVLKGFGSQRTAIFRGLRGVFLAADFDRAETLRGARALGFPEPNGAALFSSRASPTCDHHPLARPLPGDDPTDQTELVRLFVELSHELWDGRDDPPVAWHIAIESYRGDDIHALNPAAPAAITPFTNRMYEQARGAGSHLVAFPRAYQAAIRTAHAVSALSCGLGSMPFNLALLRDVGYLPLRCLPDLLSDAGFRTHAFYGSHLSYDNMLEFFRYHGVATTENVDFPKGLPTGVWGCVTDRAVFDYALARAAEVPGAQYNFILTLSGHIPFTRPQDLPPEIAERMASVDPGRGEADVREANARRLLTVAYADAALERFLQQLDDSPLAARSVAVISADHATNDDFLWSSGATVQAASAIPLVFYLPPALLARAQRPAQAAALLARANTVAAAYPVSTNDVPTLLLALLAASPGVRALPVGRRWHTMGGMATSRAFEAPGLRDAELWGIDAQSRLYAIDHGAPTPRSLAEDNPSFSDPEQMRRLGPVNRAGAAFLSAFLRGYATACPSAAEIRAGAPRP